MRFMAEIAGALTGAAAGFIAGVLIGAIAADAIPPGTALVVLVVLVLAGGIAGAVLVRAVLGRRSLR
jgi:hypothetical protein